MSSKVSCLYGNCLEISTTPPPLPGTCWFDFVMHTYPIFFRLHNGDDGVLGGKVFAMKLAAVNTIF